MSRLYNELKALLDSKGFDTEATDVLTYMDSVIGYLELLQQVDPTYSIAQWYEDTITNYPEELNNLSKVDSEVITSDTEMTSDVNTEEVLKNYKQYISNELEDTIFDIRNNTSKNVPGLQIADMSKFDTELKNKLVDDVDKAKEALVDALSKFYFTAVDETFNEEIKTVDGKIVVSYDNEEDEDSDDEEYTLYDLVNDRLFGYGVNKSSFKYTWQLASDTEVKVKNATGQRNRKNYYYPTSHWDDLIDDKNESDRRAGIEEGIGVYLVDESESELARKVAEKLNLEFEIRRNPNKESIYPLIAVIKIPWKIAEMPVEDYIKSIGKKMSDFRRTSSK